MAETIKPGDPSWPLYDPARHCQKCGGEDVHTAYHQSGYDCSWSDRLNIWDGEHQHRDCRRCGFEWKERVLPGPGEDT